jgi:hypothetical protein
MSRSRSVCHTIRSIEGILLLLVVAALTGCGNSSGGGQSAAASGGTTTASSPPGGGEAGGSGGSGGATASLNTTRFRTLTVSVTPPDGGTGRSALGDALSGLDLGAVLLALRQVVFIRCHVNALGIDDRIRMCGTGRRE